MNIEKWVGLVTAASPYSLPPGATVEQNNLQVKKPGQLTPRPGMSLIYQGTAGTVLAMYRATDGKDANDRLIICRLTSGVSGSSQSYVTLEHLTYEYPNWTRQEIYSTAGTKDYRPSICQDRFGHIYVFFGNNIRPRTFRNGIDATAIPFGLDAPTVAPTVTPTGDGWFIERVDVLASGTSYYTPPTITVSGTSSDRDRGAKLRAVVQAGAIVAVDVVDGGSNYRSVPTITVSNEQIGTGFFARGVQVVDPPVFGFAENAAPSGSSGNTATFSGSGALATTHQYGTSSSGKALIAYRTEVSGPILTAEASYNSVTGIYTTLLPLTRTGGGGGSGAYTQVQFAAASNSYTLGGANVTWTSGMGGTNQVSSSLSGSQMNYQTKRTGWYASDDYFENTAAVNSGVADRFSYWGWANIDSFWGLGFRPNTWRFAKSQVRVKGVTPDDWLGNNDQINEWGAYYFPDYSYVSYKMLVGPATAEAMANEANWQTFSSPVQVANNQPYIDIPLQPAKKSDGTAFARTSQTVFPTVRIFLAYCPEAWTVQNDNSALPWNSQNAYNKRFTPQSGQDRRANFSDTVSTAGLQNGTVVGLHNGGQNLYKRWWGQGYCQWNGTSAGFPLPRPIVDFRPSSSSSAISLAAASCQAVNPGTQMENATAFAIRFEQYNAYDYRIVDVSTSTSWIQNGPASSQASRSYSNPIRKNGFGQSCTDFYFEASAADITQQNAGQIQPGAIPASPQPTVTITGAGWTSAGQSAVVYLPTRAIGATASVAGSWTQQRAYFFDTTQLIAASPQKTIGSIQLISGGQNYYREPTILFRGGGGYGLKVQATTENGKITNVAIIDGGDGFGGDTSLYTDVQPAKLMPVLRGTMRGTYRCAYRFADYRETAVASGTITTLRGDDTATLSFSNAADISKIKPGMQLTWEGSPPLSLLTIISADNSSIINVPTLDGLAVGTSITGLTGAAGAGGRYITTLYPAATTQGAAFASTNAGVQSTSGIVPGMIVRGAGITGDVFVTAVGASSVTLSSAVTVNASVTFGPAAAMSAAAGIAYNGYATYGQAAVYNLVKIVSISGNQVTLAKPARQTGTGPITVRDMTLPISYSDFSPIVDIDASVNGSGRASTMQWSIAGVTPPERATNVEFFRTSADQSLVFYRLDLYGRCQNGTITTFETDGISDEELFDPDRPAYAALPVVLPNGGVNAFRFGVPRSDMAVAVSWQDRLWYGVSTSGKDQNTIFFSEYDEYESCPDVNELPIQGNLRTTDYLTALVPFGSVLMAMQTAHAYTVNFNTDPAVDAVVTLTAHRGCLSQTCWDIFDDQIYAADERGIYRMTKSGEVESLSESVRDHFDEARIWLGSPNNLFLRIDPKTGILRFFAVTGQVVGYPNITLCYHISNKTWWTESWPNSLTCSCDYKLPSTKLTEPIYGAFDGNIYQMAGLSDVAYRDIASITITNPGSGYTTPPLVGVTGGSGARLRAVIQDGKLVDIVILRGGWNYGTTTTTTDPVTGAVTGTFNPVVAVTITGGGGAGATATAYARPPTVGVDANEIPILSRATVPWNVKTGPMPLITDDTRGGDGQIDRSVTVTYQPTETSTILSLREFFNNSAYPRNNVMPRDRGTGFVHQTPGARTTLDMVSSQLPSGFATGLAKARFAGRSLTDMSSADRHVAIELSAVASSANSGDPSPSEALIYSLEINGVMDGGQ